MAWKKILLEGDAAALSDIAPSNVLKQAAAAGTGTTASRYDHLHDVTVGVPSDIGTTNAEGIGTSLVRVDHVHAHPSGLGATLHHNHDAAFSAAGAHTFNIGTTPGEAIILDIAQPTAAGTINSHILRLRGTSFDTAGHNADWQQQIAVTSNAGASKLILQNRIDSAVYASKFSVTDGGQGELSELVFTPKASSPSTVEGTTFYDSDDDHLYIYQV